MYLSINQLLVYLYIHFLSKLFVFQETCILKKEREKMCKYKKICLIYYWLKQNTFKQLCVCHMIYKYKTSNQFKIFFSMYWKTIEAWYLINCFSLCECLCLCVCVCVCLCVCVYVFSLFLWKPWKYLILKDATALREGGIFNRWINA